MSKEFEKAGVELRVKSEAHLKISMDRKLVDQVLINLLTNARHATEKKKNGLVQISAYSNANQSVIEIQDNGIGIDETKMDQIFIPFFSTKENGSGIGLSLSKQIMKKHKGDLTAKSQPGLGATFSLIFRS